MWCGVFYLVFLITYRPLRQSVKICVGSFGKSLFIIVRAWCMAINSALKYFVGLAVSLQV